MNTRPEVAQCGYLPGETVGRGSETGVVVSTSRYFVFVRFEGSPPCGYPCLPQTLTSEEKK